MGAVGPERAAFGAKLIERADVGAGRAGVTDDQSVVVEDPPQRRDGALGPDGRFCTVGQSIECRPFARPWPLDSRSAAKGLSVGTASKFGVQRGKCQARVRDDADLGLIGRAADLGVAVDMDNAGALGDAAVLT